MLAAFVTMVICVPSYANIGNDKENAIDTAIQNYLNSNNATAAMFELRESLGNGTYVTRYRKSYGTLTNENGATETPLNVLMRQASVTKSIIRIAAIKLIEEDKMELESFVFCEENPAPAKQDCIIPFADHFSDTKYYDIRVRNLMDHRSGITTKRLDSNGNLVLDSNNNPIIDFTPVGEKDAFFNLNPRRTPTIEDMIELMRETNLAGTPAASPPNKNVNGWWNTAADLQYAYSGVGYDLLGYVIETASGENLVDYIQNLVVSEGGCPGDIAAANPLLSGVIHGREPQYYSVTGTSTGRASNLFERSDGSLPLSNLVTYPDGTGLYGALVGGGGLTMTTNAMLLFAEKFSLRNGDRNVLPFPIGANGGGSGTLSQLIQRTGASNSFDYAITVNGNGAAVDQATLLNTIATIINGNDDPNNQILPVAQTANNTASNNAAIAFSKQYDTPCEIVSSIHRPDLEVGTNETQVYSLSNAQSITLFNVPSGSDINLSVTELNGSQSQSQILCDTTNLGGTQQKTCALDSSKLYEVEVFGVSGGHYMLDAQFIDDPIYSDTIEAENYMNTSLFDPLQVDSDQYVTYVSWPEAGGPLGAWDSAPGQIHYPVRATSSSMTLYGTVNFETPQTDSFHYKLEGHDTAWSSKLGPLTTNFEELEIATWNNLIPGKIYTLKILRREGLTEIDKLRLAQGEFANAATPGSEVWLEDFSLADGTTADNGDTTWDSNRSGTFEVENNRFKTTGSGDEGVWTSEVINIFGITTSVSVDVDDGDDTKEPEDYLQVFYKIDGGPEQLFGSVSGNIEPTTFRANRLTGNTIQIVIRSKVSWAGEFYYFDNVRTFASTTLPPGTKVAEYGDPVLGNSFNGCVFEDVFNTGGHGYTYTEYRINCDTGIYWIGVQNNYSFCTFHPLSNEYTANGSCSNWRVYTN